MCRQFGFSQASDSLVHVEHADTLVGSEMEGEQVRELIGHVKIRHGTTIITCNQAIQYLQSNRVSLLGDVTVNDDTMQMLTMRGMYYEKDRTAEGFDQVIVHDGGTTIRSKYGKYYRNEQKAYFKTKVSVVDSGSTLISDELTYYRDQMNSFADGNVTIVNKANKLTLYGDHFENYKKKKYSIMIKNARGIEIDTSGTAQPETLFVKSDTLQAYQDTLERLEATGNVHILRTEFWSNAGFAIFFTKLDSILMERSPISWYAQSSKETTQVSGDTIFVKLNQHKLRTLYVNGSAFAVSQADSVLRKRFNQMSGQTITMNFVDNAIHQVDVDRTATMLYYVYNGDKPDGMNVTSGDHGRIMFKTKKIDKIKMSGGVEGKFYPEKMLLGHESDYNLMGFTWKTQAPIR
jgi:lipopolysaccharide export system protein LptA